MINQSGDPRGLGRVPISVRIFEDSLSLFVGNIYLKRKRSFLIITQAPEAIKEKVDTFDSTTKSVMTKTTTATVDKFQSGNRL